MTLILYRRPGETLIVGDAEIHFGKVRGNSMKLAIDAPPDVQILRGEIRERYTVQRLKPPQHHRGCPRSLQPEGYGEPDDTPEQHADDDPNGPRWVYHSNWKLAIEAVQEVECRGPKFRVIDQHTGEVIHEYRGGE